MSRILSALTLAAALAAALACTAKSGGSTDSSAAASTTTTTTAVSANALPPAPDPRVTRADGARIRGDANAKLWIVVASDFQCPFCGQWERETAPQVIKEFVESGQARLAFVNFPLRQHLNAMPAAEAAMCAGAQGKFWEMHDRIFATQADWSGLGASEPYFTTVATSLGLSIADYQTFVREHVMRPMILADAERATKGGAGSTPTFFIGDQTISGAEKIEAFRTAMAKAQGTRPK